MGVGAFSIVLPCYNEAHRLGLYLPELLQWRRDYEARTGQEVEIILANDGCRDNTVELACELSQGEKRFSIYGYEKNQGRGAALKLAFPKASAKSAFIIYMDADLATDLRHVDDIAQAFAKQPERLMICGNRYYKGHDLKRPPLRQAWSWGWRNFLSLLFFKKLPDTQCGFKAISRDLVPFVMTDLQNRGFVADVEMVLRAWYVGADVVNLNILWTEKKGSTIRWSTVFKMFGEVLHTKRHLSQWLHDSSLALPHQAQVAKAKRDSRAA